VQRILALALLAACRASEPPAAREVPARAQAVVPDAEPTGDASEPCRIERVLADGRIELRLAGRTAAARLVGVDVLADARANVLEVIGRTRRPPRCELRARDELVVDVFGWQDKSGDVWEDLATVLVDMGLATVAPGAFPGRDELLRHEQAARAAHRGPW
jgi:endonuclease YncB( thermonuclease family)